MIERSWGPSYVQIGLRYAAASNEDVRFGVAASYLRTGVNELGGEWRATFLLGDEPGFFADQYQPLGPKALTFVNPAIEMNSRLQNIYVDQERAAEIKLRTATLDFGIGRELMDFGEIRGGFRVGAGDTRFRVGDPAALPYDSFHRGEIYTRFSIDTFDSISFPRQGTLTSIEWLGSNESVLGADHDYEQVLLSAAYARTWGRC
jgi:NTE family protein